MNDLVRRAQGQRQFAQRQGRLDRKRGMYIAPEAGIASWVSGAHSLASRRMKRLQYWSGLSETRTRAGDWRSVVAQRKSEIDPVANCIFVWTRYSECNFSKWRALTRFVVNQPEILLPSQDIDRIERLLDSLGPGTVPGRSALEAELKRATIVEPQDIPPEVVTMNSTVRFQIESTGESFVMTLVYPRDMDDSPEKISILAPVGSALLGLSVGSRIEWPRPGGGTTTVRIEEVEYQPERSGEYHR